MIVDTRPTIRFESAQQIEELQQIRQIQQIRRLQITQKQYETFTLSLAPDSFLNNMATWLSIHLSYLLKPDTGTSIAPSRSSSCQYYPQELLQFLQFVRKVTDLNTHEAAHVLYLVDLLIQSDKVHARLNKECAISEHNIGTVLLCSVIVSLKFNCDNAPRNSWYSKVFKVPLSVVNASEVIFLQRIHYSLNMSQSIYHNILKEVACVWMCIFKALCVPFFVLHRNANWVSGGVTSLLRDNNLFILVLLYTLIIRLISNLSFFFFSFSFHSNWDTLIDVFFSFRCMKPNYDGEGKKHEFKSNKKKRKRTN